MAKVLTNSIVQLATNLLNGISTDAIEDRSAFFTSADQITWSGTSLTWTSSLILRIDNAKGGTATTHSIAAGSIALSDGEVAWVAIDRTSAAEVGLSLVKTAIPAQSVANKNVFVFAHRIDVGGAAYLHLPFHKQLLNPGQSVRLGASGSGSGSGGINYIANPDAEAGTLGWTTYADAAGVSPVDGGGGSPTVTWTQSSSSPLRGLASFLLTKDAANRQGEGAVYALTLESADWHSALQITFDATTSASYADGDIRIYLIASNDSFSADLVVIEPASVQLMAGAEGHYKTQFQTDATRTAYRLCIHVASTNAAAYTVKIDNISLGPTPRVYGSPITDWATYTPSYTGFGTVAASYARWRRVGGQLELDVKFTAGTVAASEARVSLPVGLTSADTSLIPSLMVAGLHLNNISSTDTHGGGVLIEPSVTYVTFGDYSTFGGTTVTSLAKINGNACLSTGSIMSFRAMLPIAGWQSTVQMSDDADTRVVACKYYTGAAQVIEFGSEVLGAATKVFDTHNMNPGLDGTFYAPVSGYYDVKAAATFDSSAAWSAGEYAELYLYVDGVFKSTIAGNNMASATQYVSLGGSTITYVNKGQYMQVYVRNGSGSTINLLNTTGCNWISIHRLTGPTQIAANELVACKYQNTAGTSITSTPATVPYATKLFDTHGAYNTSTGVFTAPVSGKYRVSCRAFTANINNSTVQSFIIHVKVTSTPEGLSGAQPEIAVSWGNGGTKAMNANGTGVWDLVAGNTLEVQLYNGVTVALATDAGRNVIIIERIGF